MIRIEGKVVAEAFLKKVQQQVQGLASGPPCLVFLRVGEDSASVAYVNRKQIVAESVGITSRVEVFPQELEEAALLRRIDALNRDPKVHGILVQAPLPKKWDAQKIFNAVHPLKDVDGFHVENMGLLAQGNPRLVACTPLGILELLAHSSISTEGKHIVLVGRSLIVGRPLSLLLTSNNPGGNATLTVCHSHTQDIFSYTRQADILIAAIGRPHFFGAEAVRAGSVVIDVGINRIEDPSAPNGTRLVGDVDYAAAVGKVSHITPVPGGVGPMTVALLMSNTLKAYNLQN